MKRIFFEPVWYLVVFLLVQLLVTLPAVIFCGKNGMTPTWSVSVALVSNLLVIALFAWRRWTPYDGDYINTRPWFTLFWVACLTVGCMIPVQYLSELLGITMSEEYTKLFAGIMEHNLGFLAVGVVAPMAEEMVFRGAILRSLNSILGHRLRWVAIVVSALLFALVHGNMAQGFGAFLMGLLLGWMYIRTGSIVPGVVFHWVNNSIAVMMYRALPQSADMTLVEFFNGNMKNVALAVVFSLMIFGAALYQLSWRLKK